MRLAGSWWSGWRQACVRSTLVLCFCVAAAFVGPTVASAESLCTDTWTGPAEGEWSTVADWSGEHVPGSTDVACIGAGKTVVSAGTDEAGVVQGAGTVEVASGSLEVSNSLEPSVLGSLKQGGGSLKGAATIEITSSLAWTSGTMSGSGSTVISSGASASISGFGGTLEERALVNEGTTTLSSTAGYLRLGGGAVVRNIGTFKSNSEREGIVVTGSGAAPEIINTGLFEKTEGEGTTNVQVNFADAGTVNNRTSGSIDFQSKSLALAAGSVIEGGISFSNETVTADGVHGQHAIVSASGGQINVPAGSTATFGELTIQGSIVGTGTLDISGSLAWTSGTMSGSGSTVVLPGAIASIRGALEERTFVNEGTTTLSASARSLSMADGAVLRNPGTFNANSEGEGIVVTGSGAAPEIINAGLFEKTEGAGTTSVLAAFDNVGTVDNKTAGSINFQNNGLVLESGSSLEGGVSFSNETVTADGVHGQHATVSASGGQINIPAGNTAIFGQLIIQGTITGAGTLAISGSLSWTSGTMSGSGSTVISSGATASIVGLLEGRTFINEGTTTLPASARSLSMANGAVIRNPGTFNANSETEGIVVTGSGSEPEIVNTGVVEKTEGTGTTSVLVNFANYGTIREPTGKLRITRPVVTKEASSQYGGPGNPSTPGHPCPVCGEPVVAATGDLVETQTDLSVGGRGVGLNLVRTYNSQAAAEGVKGVFGYGWSSSFTDRLSLESGKITLHQADGATVPFTASGSSFLAPNWTQDTLTGSSEAGYTLTLADQTKYRFSGSNGRLEKITDRNGNETALAYEGSGRLETITDPAGRKLKLAYNGEGLVETATDPMGHVVKYTYEHETLATVTLPGEEKARWTFKVDGSHQITELTDGRGGLTVNEYNGSHQVIKQTDPMKRELGFEYETFRTKITNKTTGAVTLEQFTSGDEPASITHGYGTPLASTESYTYNEAGYVTSETDGDGHTTRYGYDSEGNRTSRVDPEEHEWKWEYDKTHDVISETTPKGETTTIKRDAHGNAETIERPAPESKTQVRKYKWGAHGEEESYEDPLKRMWKYEYDSKGDRTAEIDPAGDKRAWTYDEDSFPTSTVSPRAGKEPLKFTTKIERDAQERPITVTDPLGHTTKYKWDADSNLETLTDGNGHATAYGYDADNERTSTKEPNGDTTETGYNGEGLVISQTDGNKHTTKYERDILGQISEIVDPLGHKTLKEYDGAGDVIKITDPAKRTTSIKYNLEYRPAEISYSDGKTHKVEYEYDVDGERSKMIDGTGTTTYERDQLERLTKITDGHGDSVSYQWDLAEEQTKITYPNGKSVERKHDSAGRLEKTTDWLGNTITYGYDAGSNPTSTTFPSGTSEEDTAKLNDADQTIKIEMKKGSEVLASLTYTRDNNGAVKTITQKGLPGEEKPSQTLDEENRLTKAGSTEYKYDAANDPTKIGTTTQTFNEASQLEKAGTTSLNYAEGGERNTATPEKGPATSYGWNQAQNLTAVERPEGEGKPKIEDAFAYNGDRLRASQTINGSTSYLMWDVTANIPLLLNDGTNSYIYGPENLPVEQINGEGKVVFLHHDQQGSTRLLTGSTGSTEGKCSYAAYGAPTCEGAATTPLGYGAQYTNLDTGLVYLRARTYDPSTAQFLSGDPLRAYTGAPYAYALDNPGNLADPTGLGIFGEITGAVGEGVHAVGEGVQAAGEFVAEHPVIISAVGCTAGLIVIPGGAACVAALSVSYGLATGDNVSEYINGNINAEQLLGKQLLTAGISTLGALPGLPLLSTSAGALLDESSTEIQLLINGYLEAPDVAFGLLEPQIACRLGLG